MINIQIKNINSIFVNKLINLYGINIHEYERHINDLEYSLYQNHFKFHPSCKRIFD